MGPRQSVPPAAPSLVFRSVVGGAGMAERGLEPAPAAVAALPPEVRAQLAELELELSEGRSWEGVRTPGRRCGSGREGDQVAAARPGGRAGERGGRCRKSGPGSVGPSSLLSHPVKWVSRVVHCVLWEEVKQGLGEEVLCRPGLLLRSLRPETRDKAAPSAAVRACGHGGGGGEASSRVADSFLLSSTLFEGRAARLFQPPSPLQKKKKGERKTYGKSAAFLSPLTMRDAFPVTVR